MQEDKNKGHQEEMVERWEILTHFATWRCPQTTAALGHPVCLALVRLFCIVVTAAIDFLAFTSSCRISEKILVCLISRCCVNNKQTFPQKEKQTRHGEDERLMLSILSFPRFPMLVRGRMAFQPLHNVTSFTSESPGGGASQPFLLEPVMENL